MPHPLRESYWRLIERREYDLLDARGLLQRYATSIEHEMREHISPSSLGYWLHLMRRLPPVPMGEDSRSATTLLARAALEAAVQKYAGLDADGRLGPSRETPIGSVLGGLLQGPDLATERDLLAIAENQLVLTRFSQLDLAEAYDLQKLAYETWRVGANLRSIGKGAPFIVAGGPPCFGHCASDELQDLLEHFDHRTQSPAASATATSFEPFESLKTGGFIWLPIYNIGGFSSTELDSVVEMLCGTRLLCPGPFNFIWFPFNLRKYREAHLPFAEAFRALHGVSFDAVLAVVCSLCLRARLSWKIKKGAALVRYWLRGYEGPARREDVVSEILGFLPEALETLGLNKEAVSIDEAGRAISFWELAPDKRPGIDLVYPGPHYVFLPFGSDRWFIDYAWVLRRLLHLFVGVAIEDQNFKGDALEMAVGRDKSVLPCRACRAQDGSSKQIDCAYGIGNHLVIAECKAVGLSIGYDRGDPEAISHRRDYVVEASLDQADEKASWLAERPVGANYNIAAYRDILPIGVSPFVEFIHSRHPRYWLNEGTPRVLTPSELTEFLGRPELVGKSMNRVPVRKDGNRKAH